MSESNKRFWNPDQFLRFWEECHGKLDQRWHEEFVNSPMAKEICLTEMTRNKLVAIRRNRKLLDILNDLNSQNDESIKFKNTENPWIDSKSSPTDEPPKVFQGWHRWGGRWRKGF